jgi:uncharacterized membrane protein
MLTFSTSMEFVATVASAIFAGAALYINLVEHPARMACGTEIAVRQWAPSYKRATWMQAPLAVVGFLAAVLAWFAGSSIWWLLGALLLGAVVPFTLVVIMPTNARLLSPDLDQRSAETQQLLEKWNQLHRVRSILSILALLIFLLQR